MSLGTTELDIKDISSLNIAFRNKRGDVCGIINVRTLNLKERVQIIASEEVKEYLFLIENQIPGIDFIVSQKDVPKSFNFFLKSGYKTPFAWDFPLKPKELILTPLNPKITLANNNFNFSEKVSTSLTLEDGKQMRIETSIDFVPYANCQLTFKVAQNLNKMSSYYKDVNIVHESGALKFEINDGFPGERSYYQAQRLVVSIVGKNRKRREEICRVYLDNIQVTKNALKSSNLWNFYVQDIAFFKNLFREYHLERIDKPDRPLNLHLLIGIGAENQHKANKIIDSLVIKSDSLPRLQITLNELYQYFSSLLKKSDNKSLYEPKNFSTLAHSLLGLTQMIAFKKKVLISNMYLIQGIFAQNESQQSSGTKKQTPYQAIRISNMRLPSEEALSYIIQQTIEAGKAFAGNHIKTVQKFIHSRNFYAQQLDTIYTIINSFVGTDIPLNLGFAKEDLALLKERLTSIQDNAKLPVVEKLDMKKSTGLLQRLFSSQRKERNVEEAKEQTGHFVYYPNFGALKIAPSSSNLAPSVGNSPMCLRVAYGKEKAINNLNEKDGYSLKLLQQLLKMSYEEISSLDFLDQFSFICDGQEHVLLLTIQYLFYINSYAKKLVWYVKARNFKEFKIEADKMVITSSDPSVKEKVCIIPKQHFETNEELMKRLKKHMKRYSDMIL